MALPRQVQKQLDDAESIEKQLLGGKEQEALKPVAEVVRPEATQGESETKAPKEPKVAEPVEREATTKPVEDKVVEPEKPAEDADYWKQKYRTLQGMYDAEVPKLHSQLRELSGEVAELTKKSNEKPVAAETKKPQSLVTDEDVETFGQDLIEVQRKVAREVAAEFREELSALKEENVKLREQVTSTDSQVQEASFDQRLHRLVPDFDQVNVDKKWIAWLDAYDPILRASRRTIAAQAYAKGDAEAVSDYVKMFREATAKPVPNSSAGKNSELEHQIQPSRSAASASQGEEQGRMYTNADVQRMFKQTVTLSNQGKREEASALEAEIDAAYLEGRVTG